MASGRVSKKRGKVVDIPNKTITIGTASDAGTGSSVSVAFTVGNETNGGPVFSYIATSNPGSITGSATTSPITVNGLTANTAYTFKVKATNSTGSGEESASSNSATPVIPLTLLTVRYGTNMAATSTDAGATWTQRTMPSSANWYSLWYAQDKFLLAAQGTTTSAYSPNGVTWTTTTLPVAGAWSQTAFGNGKWVINGQNQPSIYVHSTDGINWTSSTGGSSYAGAGVAFGNGVFVSPETQANAGTNAWYSTDGATWTNGGSLGATTGWGRIFYGANGGFIVTNNLYGNYVSQSTTGTGSWTLRTLPLSQLWRGCIAYGNGTWSYYSNDANADASSNNGITWTNRTPPINSTFISAHYSPAFGKFIRISVSAGGHVATSSTGFDNWTVYSDVLPANGNWYSISSNG